MYIAFDQLSPRARVWIYQASRALTPEESVGCLPQLAQFAESWTSHGRDLLASGVILHQQFLVLGLDEGVAGASGCSIDASVNFLRGLERQLGLDLLDKSQLAFMDDGKVWQLDRREIGAAVADGRVAPDTFYFDNTLSVKEELMHRWPAPAGDTWLARYFVPN